MVGQRKGFTLIELLVVIAIIALLMSILMPALRNVRDQAKDSMCKQRLQQWAVMFNMYAGEWDGHLPGYNFYAGDTEMWEHAWVNRMYPYAKSFEVYLCPAATQLWRYGEGWGKPDSAWDFGYLVSGEPSWGEWFWYYNVGTDDEPIYAYGSYGENAWVAYCCTEDEGNYHTYEHYFQTVRVKGTSRIPKIGDQEWAGGFPYGTNLPVEMEVREGIFWGDGEINRFNINRHNYSVNFAFLDWSVRKVGLRQLWALKWSAEKDETTGASVWGNKSIVPDWENPEAPSWQEWPEWMLRSKNYDL